MNITLSMYKYILLFYTFTDCPSLPYVGTEARLPVVSEYQFRDRGICHQLFSARYTRTDMDRFG